MTWLDWTIVLAMYLGIVLTVALTRGHMRGVTDYLAAGRGAGRYLLTISAGIAGLGAITVVVPCRRMSWRSTVGGVLSILRIRLLAGRGGGPGMVPGSSGVRSFQVEPESAHSSTLNSKRPFADDGHRIIRNGGFHRCGALGYSAGIS